MKELNNRMSRVQDIRAKLQQQQKNLKAEQLTQEVKERLVQVKQKLAEAVAAAKNPSGVVFREDLQKLRQSIESECDQGISKVANNKPKPSDQWQSVQALKDHLVNVKEMVKKAADAESALPEVISLNGFMKKAEARLADRKFDALMNEK
jgi:DNA repair exonuclease SbcCD ATPase subunit